MKQFIVYNSQTGEIQKTGICSEHDFYLQAQDGESVIEGLAIANIGYVLNGIFVVYTKEQKEKKANKPTYDCEWSNQTFDWIDVRTDEEKYSESSNFAKLKRSELLIESDWTQLPDVPLSNKEDWATYRQALRDITDQPGYPSNINWPVQPE